jgi:hypothetical protein
MCGRYYSKRQKQEIANHFTAGKVFELPTAPKYNIAPTTFQPVVRLDRDSTERELRNADGVPICMEEVFLQTKLGLFLHRFSHRLRGVPHLPHFLSVRIHFLQKFRNTRDPRSLYISLDVTHALKE